jgi:hypothetical protein
MERSAYKPLLSNYYYDQVILTEFHFISISFRIIDNYYNDTRAECFPGVML